MRLSRRLGVPLTPKAARIMQRRSNAPGQHGPNARLGRKMSDYKMQLLEKQKLRAQYHVSERQMAALYARAIKMKGASDENLIQLLETRLDGLVRRAGFASTIYAASRNARRGRDVGTVCYAAEHRVFALIVGNAVMRFAPAEFAAMSELLHSALDAMAQLLDE